MNPAFIALGEDYPDLPSVLNEVDAAYRVLVNAFARDRKLLVCGNGGSASDSDHIVGELVKGFLLPRPLRPSLQERLRKSFGAQGEFLAGKLQGGLPAIALSAHAALATAFANDVAPELVFAQQVHVYGREHDVLLAISTSGRSANVLQALRVARAVGMRTIGMTGSQGSAMGELCDVLIRAPSAATPRIQERHLPIYHALCMALEERFFGRGAD